MKTNKRNELNSVPRQQCEASDFPQPQNTQLAYVHIDWGVGVGESVELVHTRLSDDHSWPSRFDY